MSSENAGLKALIDTLAAAPGEAIAAAATELGDIPQAEPVRGPETGLVMLRGRIGGDGAPFNLGEAAVTRATVRLADGTIGHAYALGTDGAKATLSATLAALWTQGAQRKAIEDKVRAPLAAMLAADAERRRAEAAATKVDFFTLARGEDT